MNNRFKGGFLFYTISILIPYLTIIFFILTGSMFFIIPIILLSPLLLIISTINIRSADSNKKRKKYYWIISLLAVILFFITYNIQRDLAYWVFYKSRESKLLTFISEQKKYRKITEMSDGLRYWKTLNNTNIEFNSIDIDTTRENKKYFLDDILKSNRIDKEHYNFLRTKLIETDLISFTTLEDGTLSFTIDGMLDNCYGIAYSETGKQPQYNDCGEIVKWTRIGENWYAWATT